MKRDDEGEKGKGIKVNIMIEGGESRCDSIFLVHFNDEAKVGG